MKCFQSRPKSYYKCYNWIRLTFLSGARNAPVVREKLESLQIFFSFWQMTASIRSIFPHFNPCRSHGNDILCVFAWAVRCPSVRKRLRDDLGGFNTTLLSCSDSGVKLSLSPAWGCHLPNSRWLLTRYATSRLFSPYCLLECMVLQTCELESVSFCEYLFFQFQISCLSFSAFATFGLIQFPPSWPRVTWGALKAPCGLMWVPALFCFFNRGRKSRVSHPSRPLPGSQTTGEESTSPRAAYEASGQVCIHSSFGQSACCPPSTSHPTLLALYFSMSVSSFSLHMLFLSISLTPTLFTPPSLLSLHLFCLLGGCWVGKPRLLEWKF